MAFKSQQQKMKMQQLVNEGKLAQKTFDAFNADTPDDTKLPPRATWPKSPKIKTVKILRAQKVSRK